VEAEKPHHASPAAASQTKESRYKFLEWLAPDKEYVTLVKAIKHMVCRLLVTDWCFLQYS
jgi:hypothetical protein